MRKLLVALGLAGLLVGASLPAMAGGAAPVKHEWTFSDTYHATNACTGNRVWVSVEMSLKGHFVEDANGKWHANFRSALIGGKDDHDWVAIDLLGNAAWVTPDPWGDYNTTGDGMWQMRLWVEDPASGDVYSHYINVHRSNTNDHNSFEIFGRDTSTCHPARK